MDSWRQVWKRIMICLERNRERAVKSGGRLSSSRVPFQRGYPVTYSTSFVVPFPSFFFASILSWNWPDKELVLPVLSSLWQLFDISIPSLLLSSIAYRIQIHLSPYHQHQYLKTNKQQLCIQSSLESLQQMFTIFIANFVLNLKINN